MLRQRENQECAGDTREEEQEGSRPRKGQSGQRRGSGGVSHGGVGEPEEAAPARAHRGLKSDSLVSKIAFNIHSFIHSIIFVLSKIDAPWKRFGMCN